MVINVVDKNNIGLRDCGVGQGAVSSWVLREGHKYDI